MTCPTSCPHSPNYTQPLNPTLTHNMYQNLTNNTQKHQYHYTNTIPGNANTTSTFHLWLKM